MKKTAKMDKDMKSKQLKKEKKTHKKNNSTRHAQLGSDGGVSVSHSQVSGASRSGYSILQG